MRQSWCKSCCRRVIHCSKRWRHPLGGMFEFAFSSASGLKGPCVPSQVCNVKQLRNLVVASPWLALPCHTVYIHEAVAASFISISEIISKNQKLTPYVVTTNSQNCGDGKDVISKRVPPLILNQNITSLDWCLSKREAEKEGATGLSGPLFTWALQARFPQIWIGALCKQGLSEAAVRLPI